MSNSYNTSINNKGNIDNSSQETGGINVGSNNVNSKNEVSKVDVEKTLSELKRLILSLKLESKTEESILREVEVIETHLDSNQPPDDDVKNDVKTSTKRIQKFIEGSAQTVSSVQVLVEQGLPLLKPVANFFGFPF